MATKSNKILIASTVGLAAVALLYKGGTLKDTVSSIQPQLTKLKINFPKIFATIQIFNPTNNTINIDSLVGEVFFNGKAIGQIQYINKTPIAPLTRSTFDDVLIRLTPIGLATILKDVINSRPDSGTFGITGKIFIKGLGIPFNQSMKAF